MKATDTALADKFLLFFNTEWDTNMMYTPSDFIDKFGINRHLARYHLMNLVYGKILFRVKYTNKTFYGNRDAESIDAFKQRIWMGAEVTYQRDDIKYKDTPGYIS